MRNLSVARADPLVAPDPLPERRLRGRLAGIGGGGRRRGGGDLGQEGGGRLPGGLERGVDPLDRADVALHQKLQAERLGRIETGGGRDAEHVHLGQRRRAGDRDAPDPDMVTVAEPHRDIALDQLDAVEDAAPDIARSLEGIGAAGRHQDRLVALAQPAAQRLRLAGFQQRIGNPRDRHQRGVEIDDHVALGARQRPLGGARILDRLEGPVDLPDIQRQAAQGSVAGQPVPVAGGARLPVDRKARAGRPGLGDQPAQTKCAGDADRRAHHRIVDHHDRDGGARDDVEIMARAARRGLGGDVEAGIGFGQRPDPRLGNADQHDRLGMLHQPDRPQHRIRADGDKDMDRLAGIAGGADEIRGDEGPAEGFAGLQDRRDRNVAAHGAEAVGPGDQLAGRHLVEKL